MSIAHETERRPARALTIAGSDSGGGAGIQADLKTFTVLGVYGMSAITALTAQNTLGVTAVFDAPAAFVAEQIDNVLGDIGADAAKTGMLSSPEIVEAVADAIRRHNVVKLVVDPVMVAKSGAALLREAARQALVERLLPLAYVLTPNVPEAEVLTGLEIAGPADVREAARRLHAMGARYVLMKGGHLEGEEAVDSLFDGAAFHEFRAPRLRTMSTHGTGCTLSAAIAAHLAKGADVACAVGRAKAFLTQAIARAKPLGHGHGPLNHLWPIEDASR